jgi:drug/metabolite transporter (DMT)-like permease
MNVTYGIMLKVAATLLFMIMATAIKLAADHVPAGQLVFARSTIGLVPVLAVLGWHGQIMSALRTNRLMGHAWRGAIGTASMLAWFMSLHLLPMPEAMALNYASPLIIVILSVVLLGEVVRIYRWSAVIIGLLGVLIVLSPRLTLLAAGTAGGTELAGIAVALFSAFAAALAMIQVRSLVASEGTPSIVVYFSLSASLFALLTVPFGWVWPTPWEWGLIVAAGMIGGVAQLMMTESYRHADASTIATFDYTSMLWSLILGWLVFGDVATPAVLVGTAIIIGSGVFIIIRERQLGRQAVPAALKP